MTGADDRRAWIRVAAAGTAATLGFAIGLAASIALPYTRDWLRTGQPTSVTSPMLPTSGHGLAVAFESVDLDRAAAFEAAVFEAEQRARRQLLDHDEISRWFLFRSRPPVVNGRVLFFLWFEPHGDVERIALSDLFPPTAAGQPPRAWPDHELLTFVPVMPRTTPSTTR